MSKDVSKRPDNLPPAITGGRRRPGPWLQLFQPVGLEWNRVTLPIPHLGEAFAGLRILQLTDLHLRRQWMPALDEVLRRIAADPPDLLICTGDFVERRRRHAAALPHVKRLVDGFQARLGCFAVMGNHDGKLADEMHAPHVMLLDNKRHTIPLPAGNIELIGFPRIMKRERAEPSLVPDLPTKPPGTLRIVLSHHPDYLPLTKKLKPDLFLTGHTHGGQVCLPGGWPILKHSPLPRKFCRGIHRVGNTWLISNRGIGFSGLPIRLFCPGEVIEIVLSPEPAAC